MNDEDLLGYFEIHSRTERAMFHRDQIVRLFELAGRDAPADLIEWMSARYDVVDPLVKEARTKMKGGRP
jgi:hypothetical protein